MPKIANSAVVSKDAKIAKDVTIGEFTVIESGVEIESGTVIAQNVCINSGTFIGRNNRISPFVTLGTAPQSLGYKGEESLLYIGDNNTIREYCMFNGGTEKFGGKTVIGSGNFFMAYSHVAHDCRVGDENILANGATLAGHVEMGSGINIGGLTPIHQFVKIGDLAMIAGASALSQDVPPYCMAEGNRARLIGINRVGIRRKLGREAVDAISSAYKRLFNQSGLLKEIAKEALLEKEEQYLGDMCRFILNSSRGIPYNRKSDDQ